MKLRIFVIDDEESIRDTFNWHLTDNGHEVICIAEPTECAVYQGKDCDHDEPCGDILFIDKNMPKMTGLEFIEEMSKKGCKGMTKNKVLMSGSMTNEDIYRAKELGCLAIDKPVTLAKLDELVAEMKKLIPSDRKLAEL
jgi:DNA-binding NtrC family response regulator